MVRINTPVGGPQPAVMVDNELPKTYAASFGYELLPDRGGPWQNSRKSNSTRSIEILTRSQGETY